MRRAAHVLALVALMAGSSGGALTDRDADNLAAFGRLLAYVRFFHPSDEAASADWNRVAAAGIGAIEKAPDPASLARTLEGFFRPLAPTVRVFPTGERPEIPAALRQPAARTVAWRHFGGKLDGPAKPFHSERIDSLTRPFGTLAQAVSPGDLKGRRVRLRAWVRTEMKAGGTLQLGLRVDLPGGRPGFLDNMADRPLGTTDWRMVVIEGDVAPEAERIAVLAVLTGEGRVWLDEVSLEPVQGKGASPLANPGFDEGETGSEPPGWYFPYEESIRAGYHLELRRGEACRKGGCAEIFSDGIAAPPRFSRPEEPLEVNLGGGVSALVPTALWADASGTLPRPGTAPPPGWRSVDPAPDTRDNRLAALLLAWGALAHFHPTLDIPADDWAGALRAALPEAAAASDREAYRRAVLRLLARVDDPIAGDFTHRDDESLSFSWLPVDWDWIEGRLVITGVAPGIPDVRAGDVVLEVDGKPAAEALAGMEALTSAATPSARRWLALSYLNWGVPGTSVRLRLERSEASTVTLRRERSGNRPIDTPLPPVAEPRRGIVYVDLRRIDDAEFERQLPRLAAAKGVIFDLRGFTRVSTILLSHLTERTVDTLTWQVPVFQRPDRQGVDLFVSSVTRIAPRPPRITGRLAFLADARTYRESERQLETIEAYRWGEIVGATTGGNVANPNWSNLPGGWTVAWTGRRARKHDGTLLDGAGIRPTVPAVRTLQGIAEGRDEVIERAVEVVSR